MCACVRALVWAGSSNGSDNQADWCDQVSPLRAIPQMAAQNGARRKSKTEPHGRHRATALAKVPVVEKAVSMQPFLQMSQWGRAAEGQQKKQRDITASSKRLNVILPYFSTCLMPKWVKLHFLKFAWKKFVFLFLLKPYRDAFMNPVKQIPFLLSVCRRTPCYDIRTDWACLERVRDAWLCDETSFARCTDIATTHITGGGK